MKPSTQDNSILLHIVPLVALSPEESPFFSYRSGKGLPRGSVVSISFGPRTVRGIVWGRESSHDSQAFSSRRPFRYKDVGKLLAKAFLPESALCLAEHLSHANSLALGTILPKFLPKIFPKEHNILSTDSPRKLRPWKKLSIQRKLFTLTREQKQATKNILTSIHPHTLLFGTPASGKTFVYFECIRKLLEKGGQAIILFPDKSILLQEHNRYAKIFGDKALAVFHPGMKTAEQDALIHHVRDGAIQILLGTQSALFLPFRELKFVIVDDAGAPAYQKQGITLSYDAHHTAEKLAELHNAHCLFGSSTPSFEMFFIARESGGLVTLPASPARSISFHTINLRFERWKKKLAPVSEELGNALAATIARKKQALLFVSREGMNSFSVCTECKAVFRCSDCKKPLAYRAEGDYFCAHCKKTLGTTPSCPACGSLTFQHLGAGTERVERDLARRFPHIRTVRYDRKSATQKTTFSRIQEFITGARDVLITTERGIRGWDLPHLSLIGIIDADALFGAPSWDADETVFRNILSASGRAGRRFNKESEQGDVFIQTFHPENPLFSLLSTEDLEGFFRAIEEERQLFLYPPFGTITKLIGRFTSPKKLSQEVDRVYEALQVHAAESGRTLRISPPSSIRQTPPTSKSRFFEQYILIRQSRSSKKNLPAFENFLTTLPHGWTKESK